MDSNEKPLFARIVRSLRIGDHPFLKVEKGIPAQYLKQKAVAHAIGVAVSTYGNVESSRYMVVGEAAANRLANFYALDPGQRAELLAAWRELPLSKHGQQRRKAFARRNAQRSKAKHHDLLMVSLCEVLGTLLPMLPAEQICACDFTSTCEVCTALENLGLEPFTTLPDVVDRLAKLGDQLEAKAAAGATPA
jgi:hypothetical protein